MTTTINVAESYEVYSPSFSDIDLDQQIAFGINDWVAVDYSGREFFGRTKAEAIQALNNYNG